MAAQISDARRQRKTCRSQYVVGRPVVPGDATTTAVHDPRTVESIGSKEAGADKEVGHGLPETVVGLLGVENSIMFRTMWPGTK